MKKVNSIALLFVSLSCLTHAQEMNLDELLTKANKQKVYQADKQVAVEQIKLKIQQSKRIPSLFGEANLQRNLIVPTTPVPAVAFDPTAAPGEYVPLKFATNWSAKAGLQLAFDIFNPETEGAIKEAKLTQQKALIDLKEENRSAENELKDLYAQVVLAQEQERAAQQVLDGYIQTLEIVKARYDAGRASEVEMNATLKKAYELEQLHDEALYVLYNKKVALLPYIQFDLETKFTTPIAQILQQTTGDLSTTEVESLTLDKAINDLKIRNINRLALPKLTLNGYLGTQYFNNELRNITGDYWYGTSYVNLALRIPITEAFERNLNKKQLLLESQIIDSKLLVANAQDSVDSHIQRNDMKILQQKVETLQKIVDLSDKNVAISQAQFEEGILLLNDLNKEIEAMLEQKKKLWQSQYDLLQKRLD